MIAMPFVAFGAAGSAADAPTPVCSTGTGPHGASATLCVTKYPATLDNSNGLASPTGTFTATITTSGTTSSTILGCPGQRLVPTLCVTWFAGDYQLTNLYAPFTFKLYPMWLAAGSYSVKATTYVDGATVTVSVPLTVTGSATPSRPSPNTGKIPRSTTVGSDTSALIAAVGDATAGQGSARLVSNLIGSWSPTMLFYLGDVYQVGSYQEFLNFWDPVMGQFNSITAPVPGNHEYKRWPAAAPYFWYWNYLKGTGPTATRAGNYYSFDLGGWHIIALDSDAAHDASSPQLSWLRQEIATHPDTQYPCTLAMFHRPRYSTSSISGNASVQPFWDAMVDQGVDIFLNAHAHDYERSLPLTRDGTLAPSGTGVTQFVVGTGGNGLAAWRPDASPDRFAFRDNTIPGALRLTLRPGAADYQFVGVDGSVRDAGTVPCDASIPDPESYPTPGLTFSEGFESGDLSAWTAARDVQVQQSLVLSGLYAARATSSGTPVFASKQLPAPETRTTYRLHFQLVSKGANTVTLLRLRDETNRRIVSANITPDGYLSLRNDSTLAIFTSGILITPGSWHELQVRASINGSAGSVETFYDGVRITSLSRTQDLGVAPISKIQLGDDGTGRTFDVAFDDIAVD